MKFSVVIPWHDNLELLQRAVRSIEAQTYPAHEIVIVCNGSAFDEQARIGSLFKNLPVRISGVTEGNANAARDEGISLATGDYIAFLDCDDEFTPDKLEVMSTILPNQERRVLCFSKGVRMAGSDFWIFPKRGPLPGEDIGEYIFVAGNFLSSSSLVVSRTLAAETRFPPNIKKFQDLDFIIRASSTGGEILFSDLPLYLYHDEHKAGRISKRKSVVDHTEWAERTLGTKAYSAFLARGVAQHDFPANFFANLGRFYRGWRYGGISARTIIMMMGRNMVPTRVEKKILSMRANS